MKRIVGLILSLVIVCSLAFADTISAPPIYNDSSEIIGYGPAEGHGSGLVRENNFTWIKCLGGTLFAISVIWFVTRLIKYIKDKENKNNKKVLIIAGIVMIICLVLFILSLNAFSIYRDGLFSSRDNIFS